jgi:hypothetical protein
MTQHRCFSTPNIYLEGGVLQFDILCKIRDILFHKGKSNWMVDYFKKDYEVFVGAKFRGSEKWFWGPVSMECKAALALNSLVSNSDGSIVHATVYCAELSLEQRSIIESEPNAYEVAKDLNILTGNGRTALVLSDPDDGDLQLAM